MIVKVIDFETCGLPPDNAQVVEVATVDLVSIADEPASVTGAEMRPPSPWTRGHMWRSFCNPERPIPPEASAIHQIVDDDVKGAPRFAELRILSEGADVIAAHEARFEREVWALNAGALAVADLKWICTRKCSMMAWPDAPNHKNQTLRYWLGLKLADDPGPSHRSMGDAYVTAAILRRLLTLYTVEQMITISAGPILLPRLTFGEHAMKPIAEVPWSYLDWIVNKSKGPWDEDVMHTAKHHLKARAHA